VSAWIYCALYKVVCFIISDKTRPRGHNIKRGVVAGSEGRRVKVCMMEEVNVPHTLGGSGKGIPKEREVPVYCSGYNES